MSVNITAERSVPSAGVRRIADVLLRYKISDIDMFICVMSALLIAAGTIFGGQAEFLGAFDVSVAPF